MKKILALCLSVVFALGSVCCVSAKGATPHHAAVAAAHTALAESVGKDTAGAAVLYLEGGTPVMLEGFGYANLETKALVTPDTVFEIGEISSLFTTLTVLSLVEEGKLSLDTDIAEYLSPDFVSKLAFSYPVTLRQLLTGGAGLGGRRFDVLFESEAHCFETLEEALLSDIPTQVAPPDTFYAYSPFSVTLAAFVAETVAKTPYDTLVTERVFAPLGMKDTLPFLKESLLPQKAANGYTALGDGNFALGKGGGHSFAGLYPALGATSTLRDMAIFLSFYMGATAGPLQGETRPLLSLLEVNGLTEKIPFGFTEAGGFLTVAGTYGFSASLSVDFSQKCAMLVLTNTAGSGLLTLPETVLPKTSATRTLPSGELLDVKTLAGKYLSTKEETRTLAGKIGAINRFVEIKDNEDGSITFGDKRLVQIAPAVFADSEGDTTVPVLWFVLGSDGEVQALITAEGDSYTPARFYQAGQVASALFLLLLALSCWFLLFGLLAFLSYLGSRYREGGTRFGEMFYKATAGLLGAFVLLAVFLAYRFGTGVLSSVYYTLGVLALLAGILALATHILAFFGTVTHRKRHARIAVSAVMLLAYFFLIVLWGVSVI